MPAESSTNTTIAVVATNATLDKVQMTKIAQMAHDGMARAINPVHTLWDGDTVFAAATGTSKVRVSHSAIGAIAAGGAGHRHCSGRETSPKPAECPELSRFPARSLNRLFSV